MYIFNTSCNFRALPMEFTGQSNSLSNVYMRKPLQIYYNKKAQHCMCPVWALLKTESQFSCYLTDVIYEMVSGTYHLVNGNLRDGTILNKNLRH